MEKNTSVFGIYKKRDALEVAIKDLKNEKFRLSDISVLMPDVRRDQDKEQKMEKKTDSASPASNSVDPLASLTAMGPVTIPGLGRLIGAGPIMNAMSGSSRNSSAGGASSSASGATAAFVGWGMTEEEARKYEAALKEGGIFLSVHTENSQWQDKAKMSMKKTGARDIANSSEKKESQRSSASSSDRSSSDRSSDERSSNDRSNERSNDKSRLDQSDYTSNSSGTY
jgi:hypothetical protein